MTLDIVMVKLGGSLITDKQAVSSLRVPVLDRLCSEIATAVGDMSEGLIVSHGSGSFGHVAARRHGLSSHAERRSSIEGVSEVQAQAHELHRLVLASVRDAGVASYSWVPSSTAVSSGGEITELFVDTLIMALDMGLVPVTLGDVVLDRQRGATICSTETILSALVDRLPADRLRIRRVLWMGETDGVWDVDGETIAVVDDSNRAALMAAAKGAAGTDVTGGMRHRLENAWQLARVGVTSQILDGTHEGVLTRALLGEERSGTTIVGRQGC